MNGIEELKYEAWRKENADEKLHAVYLAQKQGNRCAICNCMLTRKVGGKKMAPTDRTIDHILPKSAGGTNDISNLQLLCFRCNQEKGSEIPLEHRKAKPKRKTTVKKVTKEGKLCGISFTFSIKLSRK